MSKPCFIYPQISKAKTDLMEQVCRAQDDNARCEAIDQWFKRRIFEAGVSIETSHELLRRCNDQEVIDGLEEQRAARLMVEMILEKGMFCTQHDHRSGNRIKTYKIFWMAVPDHVGPGTREEMCEDDK